ncbi:uncharacterized protein LOC135827119 [Sycon ciliatum]|uniref:uncharacterized protein LOC135827119 n=1 Tax=Sycon ciliatum TaxID=27933 RepID=UPI0031F64042
MSTNPSQEVESVRTFALDVLDVGITLQVGLNDDTQVSLALDSVQCFASQRYCQGESAAQCHHDRLRFVNALLLDASPSIREYFCEQPNGAGGVAMVHYPDTTLDSQEKTEAFCKTQEGRTANTGELHCIKEFRDIIYKETGHLENELENEVCVFDPREVFCPTSARTLKSFPKTLSFTAAEEFCTRVSGRLPNRHEWNCILSGFAHPNYRSQPAWLRFDDGHGNMMSTTGVAYSVNQKVQRLNYVVCSLEHDYHANSTYHFNEMDLVIAPNALSSLQYKTTHVCPKGTEHITVDNFVALWTELQNTPLRHISFVHGNLKNSAVVDINDFKYIRSKHAISTISLTHSYPTQSKKK